MTLAEWRDLAIILLALEAFLLVLAPAVLLFFAIKAARRLDRLACTYLPQVRSYALRAASVTESASQRFVSPFIAASAAAARARGTLSALAAHPPTEEV